MALSDGPVSSFVIAIDKDKNSQLAVEWATEQLMKKNCSCTLIHVLTKNLHPRDDAIPKEGRPPTEEEFHQFFLPFRIFCARQGIKAKELVLHDNLVSNALTDYVINNSVTNIVVGSSQRNIFTRKFKDADVSTNLVKSLPHSCIIHIISKGKVQNIRPTGHHQNDSLSATGSIKIIATTEGDSLDTPVSEDKSRCLSIVENFSGSGSSSQNSSQSSYSSHSDHSWRGSYPSIGIFGENLEVEVPLNSDSPRSISSSKTSNWFEVEMRRLQLELEKTMEKYSSACREFIAARQKVMELEQNLQEEERNLEKARLAQEAALVLTELERQKRKAALESALMAGRLAKMENEKRNDATMRARQEEEEKNLASNALVYDKIPCKKYDIQEIVVATNYFDNAQKIGEGGYGSVYCGMLDHTGVAIKVLRTDLAHGERQFQQEVEVLSTIRHPNMVLLLGACPEYGCLVYEYLENGSLEDRLYQKNNTPPLSWQARFRIAAEIATGLLFLHQTKPEPLVHRDLKPANILLDRNYVSKISDVGLARLVPPSVTDETTQYHMTAAVGTFCYIDPEYQQTGLLGVKSDIYSLGVILLQIITGKPPMGLSHLVEKAIEKVIFHRCLIAECRIGLLKRLCHLLSWL